MASLAEAMFREASQNIRDTKPDPKALAQGIQQGAQLAQKQQQLSQNKVKLEQAKVATRNKAIEGTLDVVKVAQKFKNPADRKRFLKGSLANAATAYNTQDVFTPEAVDMLVNSEDVQVGVLQQLGKVQSGELTAAEGMQVLTTQGMADASAFGAEFLAAQKFAQSEKGKGERSKDQITAAQAKVETTIAAKEEAKALEFDQLPAKEKIKKVTALKSNFELSGGFARSKTNIKLAEKVLKQLQDKKLVTGSTKLKVLLNVPLTDQMNVLRTINSPLALAVDEMQSVINVKGALDSQFSDVMAIRVFSRIIDPLASVEDNKTRIETFIKLQKSEDASKKKLFDSIKGPQRSVEADGKTGEINIDEARVPKLKAIYTELLGSGQSPEEIFQLLKTQIGGTDAQINQLIKKFQIEAK